MVYETEVDFHDTSSFRQQYLSLSEKQERRKNKIRFISKDVPIPTWRSVTPNLEDVYIYIITMKHLESDN